ncbi:hypothetical protein F4820DRAFT_155793 [Hypoxylon rubiginosum]|uniref:Uncharacterized protein n=1 Tax=Hypoxylon rubiginosum TaxID=110542 RepID=A0ACB9YKT2_9PEZI|nr:hypothetical protein F4820DRAFT_155793 [Hypoxylon rubiginosum]
MLFFASSILFAAAVTALPSRIISRQEPVELGGFKIAAANKIIPVVVGGPQDTFVPNTVAAAVGDIIQFQFSNGNHTVTQSAADSPCQPLQATVATAIHSGHIPFQDGQTTVGTFNMPVTSADTMFLYCATGPHCQEGQVMVVNPTDNQQIVDYAKGAQSTTSSVDGTAVSGGTVASIPLADAAFVPAPAQDQAAAPPAAEAPADPAASAASSSVATDAAATSAATAAGGTITTTVAAGATITLPLAADVSVPGTTTVVVTVPAPTAAAAETPAA